MKKKTELDYNFINFILKYTLIPNLIFLVYFALISFKRVEGGAEVKFIIFSMIIWIFISIIQIILNCKIVKSKSKDYRALFYIIFGFSPLYGFGFVPIVNDLITVDKMNYKLMILDKRNFYRRGIQIKLEIDGKEIWLYKSGLRNSNEFFLKKGDFVELEIEKGILGVLKNPKKI